ncbi:putative nepenthesin [Lupinus albus]|uniref:Putative nepenthesin n=1 Tax=Lupinus albus TaxID=3870 RepID=A0A6A4P222_LUPAL|nr:putative nepenthesin [Lupinus albus]
MPTYHYVLVVLGITLSSVFNGDMYLNEAFNGGFSVELIHRDSQKSPFYNSSETQIERMANAIHRSFKRVKHFYPKYDANYSVLQTPITYTNGEYLMKFSIGTPKFDIMAVVDTGSDLVWVQCQPCKKCYKQIDPIFDPSKSKTYKAALRCSHACKSIKENGCKKSSFNLKCQYKLIYGDGSLSSRDIAQETFTFGTNVKKSFVGIDNIIFGCGHNNEGVFGPTSAGIIGLGNGVTSLTSQLGAVIDDKFSYCLSPERNIPSLLNFGEKAVVFGSGTVSTHLASSRSPTYYYLTLKGMTVAGKRIDFETNVAPYDKFMGNIIIDSGTTLSNLQTNFYNRLESLVAAQIKLERVTDQKLLRPRLRLCYKFSGSAPTALPITVHFAGADIVFYPSNDTAVYGSMAQVDFLIGIDREKKIVSFKPTKCTKL